jgi:hypothetical protein
MIAELAEALAQGRPLRLESLVKTQHHRAVSRKLYLDLEVAPGGADRWQGIVAQARAILGQTPTHVIQTRTGAHVLVRTQQLDQLVKQTFYRQLQQLR